MGPKSNLIYLLHHVATAVDKQTDQLLKEQLGIGLSQYKILMVLEWNPRIQQRAIATSLGQTEASISRQIKLLTARQLLGVKADPANKRKKINVPTPAGMQLTEQADSLIRNSMATSSASIGDEQYMQLSANLLKLHKQICRPGKTAACDHHLGF